MVDVPEVLDVRDDLERARAATGPELSGDVDEVLGMLEAYETREYGDRIGVLDRMENELTHLQDATTSETAETRFRAAANRIRNYREAVSEAPGDVGVLTTKLSGTDETDELAEAGRLRVTAVNEGEPTTGHVAVTFYDANNDEVETVASEPVMFDANEETTVTVDVTTPNRWDYYVATVRPEEVV